ncbi:unnamed protein product [Eruca vesicaria subsp. sativa]|uniref:Uncharacterized protein n=1 Tax=Eruca vesicaria subsp. sativa TaxID=29727 RepID=A0ABC8IMS0_ERUVS|nr:unnamed protein product [Eruca vesicaria subsp. sativa]
MGERLPVEFWREAPIEVVHAEFERRMGPVRTARKYNFVEHLLSIEQPPKIRGEHSFFMDVEGDDDADHIILEMEERRGAGSVYDYLRTPIPTVPMIGKVLNEGKPDEDSPVDKHLTDQ